MIAWPRRQAVEQPLDGEPPVLLEVLPLVYDDGVVALVGKALERPEQQGRSLFTPEGLRVGLRGCGGPWEPCGRGQDVAERMEG